MGRFISFEGGEGSGKSTQSRLLAQALQARGEAVVLTREPGGTPGGEAIRDLLVTGDPQRWTAWGEACLVNAARAEHVERVIRPALARGEWVVCDRFVDSTRAYQGAGKGIADADLRSLHAAATGDLWPDVTLVLAIAADLGLARAGRRMACQGPPTEGHAGAEGRFEAHDLGFHQRIQRFFDRLAAAEPGRCRQFDAAIAVDALAAAIAVAVLA